jgi:hypothetical protein
MMPMVAVKHIVVVEYKVDFRNYDEPVVMRSGDNGRSANAVTALPVDFAWLRIIVDPQTEFAASASAIGRYDDQRVLGYVSSRSAISRGQFGAAC